MRIEFRLPVNLSESTVNNELKFSVGRNVNQIEFNLKLK